MLKQPQNNPFENLILDDEEQTIESAIETGEFENDPNFEETKLMLEKAATQYSQLNTSKPITIRVNQLDLIKLKAKAKSKNIPYQTLLSSLIHLYADSDKSFQI